jgi:hypothetical protein
MARVVSVFGGLISAVATVCFPLLALQTGFIPPDAAETSQFVLFALIVFYMLTQWVFLFRRFTLHDWLVGGVAMGWGMLRAAGIILIIYLLVHLGYLFWLTEVRAYLIGDELLLVVIRTVLFLTFTCVLAGNVANIHCWVAAIIMIRHPAPATEENSSAAYSEELTGGWFVSTVATVILLDLSAFIFEAPRDVMGIPFQHDPLMVGLLGTFILVSLVIIIDHAIALHQGRYHPCGLFWWIHRPSPEQVMTALRAYTANNVEWEPLFRLVRQQGKNSLSPGRLLSMLDSGEWQDRASARFVLATSWETILLSLPISSTGASPSGWKVLPWLLRRIAHVTSERLAAKMERLVCHKCLCHPAPHPVRNGKQRIVYYGCRICGQWRKFREASEVVAVLDSAMVDEETFAHGVLRINWLRRDGLFDFDRVEILRATEYDIEHFCIEVGNDTDPWRMGRYRLMPVRVAVDGDLSENTVRILRHQFERVEIRATEGAGHERGEDDGLSHPARARGEAGTD